MDVYASEKEQVDAIKKWWKENGSSLITGVALAMAILFGGKAWFSYQDGIAGNASDQYAQMMAALAGNNSEVVLQKGGVLINEFSSSPYAALAALAMAKLAIESDDNATARNHLRWALANGKPEAIQETARIRLIQLMIVDGDLDGAQQQLAAAEKTGVYQSAFEELRGDYWVAKGDNRQAAEAYQAAIDNLQPGSSNRLFLTLKLDDTGYAVDADEVVK